MPCDVHNGQAKRMPANRRAAALPHFLMMQT